MKGTVRLPGTPSRHRFADDDERERRRRTSPDEERALRQQILAAITPSPLEAYQICDQTRTSSHRVRRVLEILRGENAIVKHGGRLPQYGLPGSRPVVRTKGWTDNAITSRQQVVTAAGSWWVDKDRAAFSTAARQRDQQAGWGNGSKGYTTQVIE